MKIIETISSKHIIKAISSETGLNYPYSQLIYKEFIDSFMNALKRDKKITLTNFGTFVVKKKNHRMGRNPRTGEEAIITARKVVKFKPAISLKKKIENNNYRIK